MCFLWSNKLHDCMWSPCKHFYYETPAEKSSLDGTILVDHGVKQQVGERRWTFNLT